MRVLLVAVVALVVVACGGEPGASHQRVSHPASLAGTSWRLVAVQGRQPPIASEATLEFGPDRVAGNAGCNSFGGPFSYARDTGALAIGDLGSTKRACLEPARNDLEAAYIQALRGVATASIDPDGRLVLSGSGVELVFVVGPQSGGAPVVAAPSGQP